MTMFMVEVMILEVRIVIIHFWSGNDSDSSRNFGGRNGGNNSVSGGGGGFEDCLGNCVIGLW